MARGANPCNAHEADDGSRTRDLGLGKELKREAIELVRLTASQCARWRPTSGSPRRRCVAGSSRPSVTRASGPMACRATSAMSSGGCAVRTARSAWSEIESGNWPADGCRLQLCFRDENDLRVSEVWESREKLDVFGEKLRPRLEEAGIQLSGEPEVFEAHNVETF